MAQIVNKAPKGFHNYSLTIDEGCKGCGGRWSDPDFSEGQCSKCKRCHVCCGSTIRLYSCSWKYQRNYGGNAPYQVAKRLNHDRRVEAGIRGYWNRQ